ncbi:MAG: glycoside hydrolase family 38 N-terminal domain-containing protein [Eubacteriales bacterium]
MLNKVYMVGSTHYDPVWLWTWDEGMSSIRSTFRAALDRMNEESGFIYSFSCPPVFEQIKIVEPAMFDEIKRHVAEGRWHLTEGLWVQPDCYSASGESYARQCLHGQRYLAENFGCISRSAFNTDSFGHSPVFPQILSKSGIEYYVLGRPDNGEFPLEDPLFFWESSDGSRITVYRDCDAGGPFALDTAAQIDIAFDKLDNCSHDLMLIYGVTNHGGAPTKKAIADINRKNAETGGRIVFGDTGHFFKAQKGIPLKTYCGEIPFKHFGVFANLPQIKKCNRKTEYMLYNAERAALFNSIITGVLYPSEKLTGSCRDILFNQFHDILGGASITDAYTDAFNLYGRAAQTSCEIMHTSLQRITSMISLENNDSGAVWNLVVWNLNSFEYNGAVEGEVQWAWEFDWYDGDICVTDDLGKEYVTQKILPRSVIPGFRSRFVFRAVIPALGYNVFRVCQKKASEENTGKPSAVGYVMENDDLRVEICRETGGIKSIISKPSDKILAGNCSVPLVLEDKSDVWAFNFAGYNECGSFRLRSAEVIECGEVRCRIRTVSVFGQSELIQDFILYTGSDVIEGAYKVIWHEKQKTLKLRFCPIAESMSVTASVPYGSIKRNFDGREMPVGEWLTAGDGQEGLTLSFDSLFSYDTTADEIRATVLRSPIVGDLRISELDSGQPYEYLNQGVTEGRWRLTMHVCDITEAWKQGSMLNNPPVIVTEANHGGTYPLCKSFAVCGDDGVYITALKKSEDKNAVIVRLQNLTGDTCRYKLQICGIADGEVVMTPHEIKTLRIENDLIREVGILEDDVCNIIANNV